MTKTRHRPMLGTKPLYGDMPPKATSPLCQGPILVEGPDADSILLMFTQITLALVNLNKMT